MNYLAHLLLTYTDEQLTVGNFLADMSRNSDVEAFPSAIKRGVAIHRFIDTFTDNHDAVRACVHRLHPTQGKYAPVVVDILFDHILYKHWNQFSGLSYERFKANIYTILNKNLDYVPEKRKKMVHTMLDNNFLTEYITFEGLERTFSRISRRTKFEDNFHLVVEEFKKDYAFFETQFLLFFPELQKNIIEEFLDE